MNVEVISLRDAGRRGKDSIRNGPVWWTLSDLHVADLIYISQAPSPCNTVCTMSCSSVIIGVATRESPIINYPIITATTELISFRFRVFHTSAFISSLSWPCASEATTTTWRLPAVVAFLSSMKPCSVSRPTLRS